MLMNEPCLGDNDLRDELGVQIEDSFGVCVQGVLPLGSLLGQTFDILSYTFERIDWHQAVVDGFADRACELTATEAGELLLVLVLHPSFLLLMVFFEAV